MKIAIVGGHQRHKRNAPYADPKWQIWSCSPRNVHPAIPRHDLWFETHDLTYLERDRAEYMAWLKTQPDVLMNNSYEGYPGSSRYPYEGVVERFGTHFLRNTICLMSALALMQPGLTDIGWWGVEQTGPEEYKNERLGVQHWVYMAREMGVKRHLPPGCQLMRPVNVYPMEAV